MPTRDVIFNIIGRDGLSSAFDRAAASTVGAAARISRAGDRIAATGHKLTHRVTLPIIAIGAASAKMATDFNSAMTRIQTQAGGSARDVGVLSKEVLGLAKYAQQGPVELADSLYHLKSVGLDNVGAMKALRQSADFAAVGHANLEETTNALAGAWRTGIRGAKDFHGAVATLNAIIGAGNMRMEDLNLALGTGILPTAKTFGLTLKDVGAALALFTDEGVPADAAATRLRMSISLLGAPSAAAEKQLKKVGLTGLQLANDMRKRNGLIVAIGDLKAHVEDPKFHLSLSKQAELLSHAFGGGRSSSAILSMINNYDVLKQKQQQVTQSMGKFDDAVKAQRDTPQAKFKLMESSLQRAAILLGNDILPGVVTAADDVGKLAEKFNALSPAQKHIVVDTLLILAALGPVLSLGGRVVRMFGLMGGAAARAVGFMAAPYKTTAAQAEVSAMRVEQAQLTEQLAVERAAALIAVAEAEKANATAEAAVSIAASLEGTNSVLAANSTVAAENAIEFAAAQQAKADAAVLAAAETDAAWTKSTVNLRTAAAGTSRSVYGLQSAMAGLGIGLTVGTFTRGASTSTKLMGALGSAAAGAAVGWSMGGPWGAAIGGLLGGLSDVATAFSGDSEAAKRSAEQQRAYIATVKQEAEEYLGILDETAGAYDRVYKSELARRLATKGVFDKGEKIGLSDTQIMDLVTGKQRLDSKGIEAVFAKLPQGKYGNPGLNAFLDAISPERDAAAVAEKHYQQQQQAQHKLLVSTKLLAQGTKSLNREFANTGRGLSSDPTDVSGGSRRNTEIIKENVDYLKQQAIWAVVSGKSFHAASAQYGTDLKGLRAGLVKVGFSQFDVDSTFKNMKLGLSRPTMLKLVTEDAKSKLAEVQGRLRKYGAMKPSPKITAKIDQAEAEIKRLRTLLATLHNRQIDITTVTRTYHTGHANAANPGTRGDQTIIQANGKAGGGGLPRGWTAVGEAGPELAYNTGQYVHIFSNSQSKAIVADTGMNAPGFAGGTMPSLRPAENGNHRRKGGALRITLDLGSGRTLDGWMDDAAADALHEDHGHRQRWGAMK